MRYARIDACLLAPFDRGFFESIIEHSDLMPLRYFALGQIAAGWCAVGRRKTGKARALPDALQAVLDRLTAPAPEARYASASDLLDDLERARAEVPANPEAWDRLLRQVRDEASPLASLRQTA